MASHSTMSVSLKENRAMKRSTTILGVLVVAALLVPREFAGTGYAGSQNPDCRAL